MLMIRDITDGICVIDHENRVVWINTTFKKWFAHHGSILGKTLNTIFPSIPITCTKGHVVTDKDRENRKRYFEVECISSYDDKGVKVSDMVAFRDITVMQTLLNISDLTISASNSRELLDMALDIVGETLGYKTVAALLKLDTTLELAASRGYSPMLKSLLAKQKISEKEKGLAGQTAFFNRTIVKEIKEGTISSKLLQESRRLGISAVVTIPLTERGEVIGVMAISTSHIPTPEELSLLKIVSNQISVSLQKILFEEKLVSAREEIELYIDLMCHDITNANQVAMGYLELVAGAPQDEKDQYIGCAVASILRVNSLIDNVRKIRAPYHEKIEVMSIADSMDRAIKDAYCLADSLNKPINIFCDVDPSFRVRANYLLKELFYNVLDVIIHRIYSGGTVDIKAKESNNSYEVIYEDTGPGIESVVSPLEDIGQRYLHIGRFGLSIYLVQNLIRRFGGTIQIDEKEKGHPDRGNRITLTLRKA